MRLNTSHITFRLDRIKELVSPGSSLYDLRLSGNGMYGYQIYYQIGEHGAISVLYQGPIRECVSFLDGLLVGLNKA